MLQREGVLGQASPQSLFVLAAHRRHDGFSVSVIDEAAALRRVIVPEVPMELYKLKPFRRLRLQLVRNMDARLTNFGIGSEGNDGTEPGSCFRAYCDGLV